MIEYRSPGSNPPPQTGYASSMSLRDWFAGKALSGMTENDAFLKQVGKWVPPNTEAAGELERSAGRYQFVAQQAYALADAMLKERQK